MTDPDELRRTLDAVAQALDALQVPWAVGGSVASAAYGEPRATNDVDIVARLDEAEARELTRLLGPEFYADADMAAEAARTRRSFNVLDQRSFIKVDIFVPGPGALGIGQLARAKRLELFPGAPHVAVLGPEDVLLQKLAWYRMGGEGSDRQWRDLVSVIRGVGSDLDNDYLDQVAQGEGLATLLARARGDAD